jgi:hypothetical protein
MTTTNVGAQREERGVSNIPSSAGAFVIEIPPAVKICQDFIIYLRIKATKVSHD